MSQAENSIPAIGLRIRAVRKELRMTQDSLAQALGISQGTLNRWENGVREPSADAISKLARIAGNVSLAWLLKGEGHPDDVEQNTTPGVSSGNANSGSLSLDQVGKLLAAAERERLTPDQRALLAEYDALPAHQRDLFWRMLRSARAEQPEPPPTMVNDADKRRGER